MMDEENNKKNKTGANLLKDDRFKALFENPEFQVDKNADEYRYCRLLFISCETLPFSSSQH